MASSEKIVSPGVFTNEIDQSFLPAAIADIGAAVVGPTVKGPAMVPTIVTSYSEYVEMFGDVESSGSGDVQNYYTYLTSMAAKNYLKNSNTLTVCRVLAGNYLHASANVLTGSFANGGYTGSITPGATEALANTSFKLHTLSDGNLLNNKDLTSGGESAATAALSCVDGDLNTNGQFTEGEYVEIISTDGTKRIYVLCDGSETGASATGTVITAGDDTGASTLQSGVANRGTCVAVQNNLNTHTQAQVLNEIKAAIVHANGHNGKITCGDDVSGDGAKTITLTQAIKGKGGNRTSTVTTNPQITCANFTGGGSDPVGKNGLLISGSQNNIRWEVSSVNQKKGTFTLNIRRGDDLTNRKQILETFSNVSLDPNTSNYISKAVGTQKLTFRTDDAGEAYLQPSGSYINKSKYVRVEVIKQTSEYIDENGSVRLNSLSASLPGAGSGSIGGAFTSGSDGTVTHPKTFYENISENSSQGLDPSNDGGASGYDNYINALNLLKNQDEYDLNLLLLPGIFDSVHSGVAGKAIDVCESRGDCFVILDPVEHQKNIADATTRSKARNSSYGAMYWPWLQVNEDSLNKPVWVPPSVSVVGMYSFNDKVSQPWFAPAGLNRGTLDTVMQAERKLTQSNRDDLYDNNVNPIATFPGQGVVVWGQKTLQKKASALDRVNVRRLLIKVKKFIASSSRFLLFEQNNAKTRNRFLNIVNPFLEQVQAQSGVNAFRVVMDESNNTPDVVDRNQMYGQIFVQPAKTAEFIVLDFTIQPTGATFPE